MRVSELAAEEDTPRRPAGWIRGTPETGPRHLRRAELNGERSAAKFNSYGFSGPG